MTGPQFREPPEPPVGVIGHRVVLAILIAGAFAALVFASLAA
jgi:hypothetical protein